MDIAGNESIAGLGILFGMACGFVVIVALRMATVKFLLGLFVAAVIVGLGVMFYLDSYQPETSEGIRDLSVVVFGGLWDLAGWITRQISTVIGLLTGK